MNSKRVVEVRIDEPNFKASPEERIQHLVTEAFRQGVALGLEGRDHIDLSSRGQVGTPTPLILYDNKYGEVEFKTPRRLKPNEPIFIFRGQDQLLLPTLYLYLDLCRDSGSPERHLLKLEESIRRIEDWQRENTTKVPSSDPMPEESDGTNT